MSPVMSTTLVPISGWCNNDHVTALKQTKITISSWQGPPSAKTPIQEQDRTKTCTSVPPVSRSHLINSSVLGAGSNEGMHKGSQQHKSYNNLESHPLELTNLGSFESFNYRSPSVHHIFGVSITPGQIKVQHHKLFERRDQYSSQCHGSHGRAPRDKIKIRRSWKRSVTVQKRSHRLRNSNPRNWIIIIRPTLNYQFLFYKSDQTDDPEIKRFSSNPDTPNTITLRKRSTGVSWNQNNTRQSGADYGNNTTNFIQPQCHSCFQNNRWNKTKQATPHKSCNIRGPFLFFFHFGEIYCT